MGADQQIPRHYLQGCLQPISTFGSKLLFPSEEAWPDVLDSMHGYCCHLDTEYFPALLLCSVSCGLEHFLRPALGKKWPSPSCETRKAQGVPRCPHHSHLLSLKLPLCIWASLGWRRVKAVEIKPVCILYSMVLNFFLGNLCMMILINLRSTGTCAAERACMQSVHLIMGQGHNALYTAHLHYWVYLFK